ncbi:MAG: hypothetical protein CMQ07_09110 [Gammaproteobacteria bacterium]|nr:hypothetical protein [Gammaproteobacteria bacterium]HCL72560.1 hypothetical protein [Gammaproteobacteria bacterium]
MGTIKRIAFTFIIANLSGCSVGKDPEDTLDSDSTPDATQSRLTIALSGNTKYRADETVTLTYALGGELASDASVTYDGTTQLVLDTNSQTISGTALAPGVYDITVSATADQTTASQTTQILSDANFGGRYTAAGDESAILTMTHSSATEGDDGYVLSRTGGLYWYTQEDNDTKYINRLCAGSISISGDTAEGEGFCKFSSDGSVEVAVISDLTVAYQETGDLALTYSYDGSSDSFEFTFSGVGEAYVNPDTDYSGAYLSMLKPNLDLVIITDQTIDNSLAINAEVAQCSLSGVLQPYSQELITATEGDGSIVPVTDLNIGNCDLTNQDGYIVAVGDASGEGQSGLLQIFESGIDDNTLRFDLYAKRGAEYPDPVSKLRYARVCFKGLPTPIASDYDITEQICEALVTQ